MRTLNFTLASLLAFVLAVATIAAEEGPTPEKAEEGPAIEEDYVPPLTVRTSQGVAYVTGGVGKTEREKLEAMKSDFNLKLIFAAKGGPFLGDVIVEIRDESGNKVFDGRSDGPWFLLKLPPGSYRILATSESETFERKAKVNETGLVEVHFYWQRNI